MRRTDAHAPPHHRRSAGRSASRSRRGATSGAPRRCTARRPPDRGTRTRPRRFRGDVDARGRPVAVATAPGRTSTAATAFGSRGPSLSAEELIGRVMADPDRAAPTRVRHLPEAPRRPGDLRVNDEFVVRMPGPWDGPVRVASDIAALVSLRHPRRAPRGGPDRVPRRERRAARVRDRVVGAQRRPALRAALRPAAHIQGDPVPHVDVVPRAASSSSPADGEPAGCGSTPARSRCPLTSEHARRRSSAPGARRAARQSRSTSTATSARSWTREAGWRIDDYCQPLPARAARPARARRARWERARALMRDYEFADPRIVRAVYHRDSPARGPRHAARGPLLGPALPLRRARRRRDRRDPRRSTAATCGSGAGATPPSRATSRWARWTTRSGSGSTRARSSSASTSSRGPAASATRSSGSASASSGAGSRCASQARLRAHGLPRVGERSVRRAVGDRRSLLSRA